MKQYEHPAHLLFRVCKLVMRNFAPSMIQTRKELARNLIEIFVDQEVCSITEIEAYIADYATHECLPEEVEEMGGPFYYDAHVEDIIRAIPDVNLTGEPSFMSHAEIEAELKESQSQIRLVDAGTILPLSLKRVEMPDHLAKIFGLKPK